MSNTEELVEEQLPLEGAGDQLRHAREAQGKSLDDMAQETRIPRRHLETLEAGGFAELPSRAYAIGFSRTYARELGLDEHVILDGVRAELAQDTQQRETHVSKFEPGDPARVPSRGLAWFSAFAVILLFAGLIAFFGDRVFPGAGPGSILEDEEAVEAAPVASEDDGEVRTAAAPADASGQVVFTALEDNVWVRFYESDGDRLLEKVLARGETFAIPADANDPRINTGRPDALAITIGGREVAKLSDQPTTVGDAPVNAAALLARADTPATPAAE